MITFDFGYYRPDTLVEAHDTYQRLTKQNQKVVFYAGGTEIINAARLNQMQFDALIDLKKIPELNLLAFQQEQLVIGAGVTLTKIADAALFPFLGAVTRKIADHTARDKITLGGNLCGKTPYKEALLPLLLTGAKIVVAGLGAEGGFTLQTRALTAEQELPLSAGEFMVQVVIDKQILQSPYSYVRRTRQEKIGYPLVAVAALAAHNGDAALTGGPRLKVAFSGLRAHPFSSPALNAALNNPAYSLTERLDRAMQHFPAPWWDDVLGSAAYRAFTTRRALEEAIEKIGGMPIC